MLPVAPRRFIFLIALTALLAADFSPAEANPGFARRFGFSCVMCHSAFPKLNSFGETFAGNGYQLPGQKIESIAQGFGDPKLYLEKNLNLAVRVDSFLRYRNASEVHTDIEVPFLAKIFVSAYLKKDVTFYFYFLFDEAGEVAGLEDAFFYFNNVVGEEDLDMVLGQFQVVDVVYPREQRLTFQDIVAYTTVVSPSEFSLTYHRGAQWLYSKGPLDLTFGIVNGNGIREADANDQFDNNSYLDPFGRVGIGAGGFLDLGFYGFLGKDEDTVTDIENRFYRLGPDVRIQAIPKIDIRAQWLAGRDKNPDFLPVAQDVDIQSGFSEVVYLYSPDWLGVLLYNWYDANGKNELDQSLLTVNLTHYIARNFKIFWEYTHDLQTRTGSHPEKNLSAELGLVGAF